MSSVLTPSRFQVNEAWLVASLANPVHIKNDPVDIYVLVDVASTFILGDVLCVGEAPTWTDLEDMFTQGRRQAGRWPRVLFVPRDEPVVEALESFARGAGVATEALPRSAMRAILGPLEKSFGSFMARGPRPVPPRDEMARGPRPVPTRDEEESAKALVPHSYDPCPCASGKKYKFCCKPILREVTESMCAVQDGDFPTAVEWMDKARAVVGDTAEVLSRYAVVYGMRSDEEMLRYLRRALEVNPAHPRSHYLLGLHHKEHGRLKEAEAEYLKAVAGYPDTDQFHLNETWNNLGVVYEALGDMVRAKDAWERAVLLLPSDDTSRENLVESIYNNPHLPAELRVPSPAVRRHLRR